jgi:hypothetical protein
MIPLPRFFRQFMRSSPDSAALVRGNFPTASGRCGIRGDLRRAPPRSAYGVVYASCCEGAPRRNDELLLEPRVRAWVPPAPCARAYRHPAAWAHALSCRGRGKTFKPQKNIPEGTKQYQLKKYAEATLGSGNLRLAVALPEGEDLNEWLAVNSTLAHGRRA